MQSLSQRVDAGGWPGHSVMDWEGSRDSACFRNQGCARVQREDAEPSHRGALCLQVPKLQLPQRTAGASLNGLPQTTPLIRQGQGDGSPPKLQVPDASHGPARQRPLQGEQPGLLS